MIIKSIAIILTSIASISSLRSQEYPAEPLVDEMQNANPFDSSEVSVRRGFPNLAVLDAPGGVLCYDPHSSTVIRRRRTDLPRANPLFADSAENLDGEDVLLLKTLVNSGDKDTVFVLFGWGPSADPAFYLVKEDSLDLTWETFYGTSMAIPGNGTIYVAGRYNRMHTKRCKFIKRGNRFEEVPQPLYYVGLRSKCLVPVTLYSSPGTSTPIANLSAGMEIEVLLASPERGNHDSSLFLARTPFGLVGWIRLKQTQYISSVIEGISFWGD